MESGRLLAANSSQSSGVADYGNVAEALVLIVATTDRGYFTSPTMTLAIESLGESSAHDVFTSRSTLKSAKLDGRTIAGL